jgi:predicted RNase H-like HicB family nuclease
MKKIETIQASLPIIIGREDDTYIAYCPALDLSTYADSEEEVKQAFEEVLGIFLEETERLGTFEKELLRLGWQVAMTKRLLAPPREARVPEAPFPTMAVYCSQMSVQVPA